MNEKDKLATLIVCGRKKGGFMITASGVKKDKEAACRIAKDNDTLLSAIRMVLAEFEDFSL